MRPTSTEDGANCIESAEGDGVSSIVVIDAGIDSTLVTSGFEVEVVVDTVTS